VKPARFEYHAPRSADEALDVLAEHADEAKALAGGQSLVPMLALRLTRFAHLVDLNRVVGLDGIERRGSELVVGAMTRQRTVERSEIAASVPLLARATPLIGHFQIRNRGTLGGSLAHADPAAEYPAVALCLDASFELRANGRTRRVPARDFFLGTWTTAVEPDELLVAVTFPVSSGRTGSAIDEVTRRAGDFALVGAACAVEMTASGMVADARISMFGMDSTPVRAGDAEQALVGVEPRAADLHELGELAVRDLDPPGDVHASSRYRRVVGAHTVARALGRAIEEAME
jgi:carbon-monoxide dehydrogenase medium subunit